MEYKKRLHWDRYRPEIFKIGFIFSLAMVFMAFNYTTMPPVYEPFEIEDLKEDVLLVPPITVHKKKVLPPPPPEKKIVVEVEPSDETPIDFVEKVEFKEEVEPRENVEIVEVVTETAPIVDIIVKDDIEEDIVVMIADRMPLYGDCNVELDESERRNCSQINLINHTYKNVRYPALAREAQVEGTVVISFVVNRSGEVEDIKILRDIGMGCGKEVIKAIKKLDKFLPGKQNGRPVSVMYRFPVKFVLE